MSQRPINLSARSALRTAFLFTIAAGAAFPGSITDFGPTQGITGLNNQGHLLGVDSTGWFIQAGTTRTYIPPSQSGLTNLVPMGINNNDEVVGYGYFPGDSASHAFVYQNGVTTELGPPNTRAYGLNDNGWVVGITNYTTSSDPFLYDGQHFGTIPGATGPATKVSNNGLVIGPRFAYTKSGGVVVDPTGYAALPEAVSSNDQIVGDVWLTPLGQSNPSIQVYLHNPGDSGDWILGTLGGRRAFAKAINAGGQIVGQSWVTGEDSYTGYNVTHAFLVSDNTLTDPNNAPLLVLISVMGTPTGWSAYDAFAINDSGMILGLWDNPAGQSSNFLYDPNGVSSGAAPEPGSVLLFATGLAAVVIRRRRSVA